LSIIIESTAEDTGIDTHTGMDADIGMDVDARTNIDPRLADYHPPSINPIPYRSGQNLELIQNTESQSAPKKRKMMKLSNGMEIPEPHWSMHKPTTHAGVIKEMYGPKLKLHQHSRGRFKASSMFLRKPS